MDIKKFIIGYDTYERHRMVAQFVTKRATKILDVGGGNNVLKMFVNVPVIVTNIEEGDVFSSGFYLPFPDSSFDVVTSLDVLEHIHLSQRSQFIDELIRVARQQVILCAPYGSPEHILLEYEMLNQLTKSGVKDRMLAEHVQYGLPKPDDVIEELPKQLKKSVWFTGDIKFNKFCFYIDHIGGNNSYKIIKLVASLLFNFIGILVVLPLSTTRKPSLSSNRMFIEIVK